MQYFDTKLLFHMNLLCSQIGISLKKKKNRKKTHEIIHRLSFPVTRKSIYILKLWFKLSRFRILIWGSQVCPNPFGLFFFTSFIYLTTPSPFTISPPSPLFHISQLSTLRKGRVPSLSSQGTFLFLSLSPSWFHRLDCLLDVVFNWIGFVLYRWLIMRCFRLAFWLLIYSLIESDPKDCLMIVYAMKFVGSRICC